MIELRHLRKEFDGVTPLEDVNAVINDGEIISVIGPSGCGKSTLLRCINMLETPTSGQVLIDGEDVTDPNCDLGKIRQKTGMVFQSFNLFGHLKVIENVMLAPVDLLGMSRQEAYDRGMFFLKAVGLSEKAMNYPDELSGGQKQRVAIARTLAMDPKTILLDEPTSALDPNMVGEVQAVIRKLTELGKTMLIVTHEMNFARSICNRVFYMDEGGIYEEGTPEQIFDHPQKEKTRRFIRRLKVLELEIHDQNYDFPGAQTEITRYCQKNQIPRRMDNRLQLVFEETVQQQLIPKMENPDILVTFEYSEETEKAAFTVRYDGEKLNITAEGDPLTLSVLKGMAENIQYAYHPEEDRKNEVTMMVV